MKLIIFLSLVLFSLNGFASDKTKAVEFSASLPFKEVENFLSKFKQAVKDRSCFGISALTDYPLTINYQNNSKKIWNRTALCRYFPILFNENRSNIVLNQDILDMPVGYRGLMFGNGIFWLSPVCKIKGVNCFNNNNALVLRLQVANIME